MNRGLKECVELGIDYGLELSDGAYEEYLKEMENAMSKEYTTIVTAELTFISNQEKKINKKQMATNIKHMVGADDVVIAKVQEFEFDKESRSDEIHRKMRGLIERIDKVIETTNELLVQIDALKEK